MTGPGARFQQLLYTSCEHGLSGFSGFQFNAVSPGVSAETMRTVEALAGYDPPRPLAESDTPGELARCPVNLCFVPSENAATCLCVRYVGRDSARRFGNYFAHALYSDDFAAAGGGMLGIELWGSPGWTAEVAPGTEIPVLTDPPARGPLTPRAVGEFVRAHPDADQLEHLLAAAFTALAEERSVVVIDTTTDRIAHWFAAVSYLLPPPLARQLSFATYLFRPTRSRLHLIGAVPEARPGIGPDDQESYLVFDFAARRFPEIVPVHPLVRLLVRIGIGSIGPLWSWTAEYTDGAERHLGDWHAPVAAAAAAGGLTLTAADVAAVSDWLPGAAHLGRRRAVVARDLCLPHRELDEGQLAALSAAALAGGDPALHQDLEGKLYESRMRAYAAGDEIREAPVAIADPAVRASATALWRELLAETAGVRQRVRLLLWAHGAELDLPEPTVRRVSADLARDLLEGTTRHAAGPAFRRETEQLLRCVPRFAAQLVAGVAELIDTRDGHPQLFSQFPARLLDERDLEGRPELLEHYWTALSERNPERTVELMIRILEVRGQRFPDADLLSGLWRRPPWSHEEAIDIAGRLSERLSERLSGQAAGWVTGRVTGKRPGEASHGGRSGEAGALGEWFDRAVCQEIDDRAGLDACLDLCDLLSRPPRSDWLPSRTKESVAAVRELGSLLHSAREATVLAGHFTGRDTEVVAPLRALKRFRLVDALLRLPADPGQLPTMLAHLGFGTADAYLRAVHAEAVARDGEVGEVLLSHVAGLFLVDRRTELAETHRGIVTAVRGHAERVWRVGDTERLAAALGPHNPELADALLTAAHRRLSASQKLLRRFGRRGTPDRGTPDRGTPDRGPGERGPATGPDRKKR
ncbi:GTPase-associated protein 1-related protein [Streptomyces sp. NPDC087420]|uniref:GTPase-associated protein 1-related protein n=1 Tax=Streptomyces sp. NPDC087420 TaxID=3365785 RepID=UPI0038394525